VCWLKPVIIADEEDHSSKPVPAKILETPSQPLKTEHGGDARIIPAMQEA
jgi:hypothetical protein